MEMKSCLLRASTRSNMRQINVLLVEDNTDHEFLTRSAFEAHEARFALAVAGSGREALSRISLRQYDVAFIDLHLPDTDGLSLMKKIRNLQPSMQIVITTGKGSEEVAVSTFREGAADYIIKNQNYFSLLPDVAARVVETSGQGNGTTNRPPFSADKVYEQILSASADLLDVHASSLMLYDELKGCLETKAHRGLSLNYLTRVKPALGESIEGLAVAESKPMSSANIVGEPNYLFKELADHEGIRSALSVPFMIDDTARGVLNLYSHRQDRFQAKDEQIATHLVKLSALALKNLNLYYRERHIAETLQKSHFPEIDSRFDNWEVAYRYKVSMEEALLGGDFYDMFPVAGNRRAIVVADVSGKGIAAAAQTAMVKYTLRSYALDDPDPAAVLLRTHAAFCSYTQSEHFVTIFYGLIDPASGTISYCSAGHPPALFYAGRQQRVFPLSDVHVPVGAWHEKVSFSTSAVVFDPGDTLLVYTDGLTDCRELGQKTGNLFGQAKLEQLFGGLANESAETIANGIIDQAIEFCAGKMRDDVAFFVIKLRQT